MLGQRKHDKHYKIVDGSREMTTNTVFEFHTGTTVNISCTCTSHTQIGEM